MKKVLLIGLFIMSVALLSGCLETQLPSEENLRNKQVVDAYCQSKGYEYGSTKYLRSSERWELFDEWGGNIRAMSLGDYGIMCVRFKKEYGVYSGSDYKSYSNKIIYIKE